MILVHGTCIDLDGAGVLLCGPSGAGKSDLALRLIDGGARLVSDDQVELHADGPRLRARAPGTIAGLLEVRGLGILGFDSLPESALALAIELVARPLVERLPEDRTVRYLGLSLPCFALCPWDASAANKVRLAVRVVTGCIMRVQ